MYNNNRLPLSTKSIKIISAVIFIIMLIPVAIISTDQIKDVLYENNLKQEDIRAMYAYLESENEMPGKYNKLWEELKPLSVSLERISLDLENRIEKNSRYFDKTYIEELTMQLESYIIKEPKLSLYLLSYQAKEGNTPIKQTLSMIAIREMYPKKHSLYSANHLANSENKMLSDLARSIIKNNYQTSSIKAKYTPKYIKNLIGNK